MTWETRRHSVLWGVRFELVVVFTDAPNENLWVRTMPSLAYLPHPGRSELPSAVLPLRPTIIVHVVSHERDSKIGPARLVRHSRRLKYRKNLNFSHESKRSSGVLSLFHRALVDSCWAIAASLHRPVQWYHFGNNRLVTMEFCTRSTHRL